MALIGRLHPLLVHPPVALVLIAAVAEVIATFSGQWRWRAVAVANVRAGAAFGLVTAIAGWRLASAPGYGTERAARVASLDQLTCSRRRGRSPSRVFG